MFTNKELFEINPNSLYLSRNHISCDITVQIPEELYKKYKSGEIDRETFENHICVFDSQYTSIEINYFDEDEFSEMVEEFLEDQERDELDDKVQEELLFNKLERITELEAELAELKKG